MILPLFVTQINIILTEKSRIGKNFQTCYSACLLSIDKPMEEPMSRYDAVFEWSMTPPEVEAYKLAILYEKEFIETFSGTEQIDGQDYRRNTIPKRGDPRKSDLFHQCWRLRRETRGLLTPEQYKNYVKANLTILKINKAYVAPNTLCGDKAWIRWKVWERWYSQKMSDKAAVAPIPSVNTTDPKVIREIDRTKKFLFEKCEGEPTCEKIRQFLENGFFKFWISSGKVSTYYVMMSPYAQPYIKSLAEACTFDPLLFQQKLTSEVRDYFHHEFSHEFRALAS